MLMISSGLQKLSAVFGRSMAPDTLLDQYEPTPLPRANGAWTDEAAHDVGLFAANTFQESERLESQTLSMIRSALYTAE